MQKPICNIKLSELAEQFNLKLEGDGDTLIDGVGTLSDATGTQISFLSNPAYREQLETTQAAAVIISADDVKNCQVNALVDDLRLGGNQRQVVRQQPNLRHEARLLY